MEVAIDEFCFFFDYVLAAAAAAHSGESSSRVRLILSGCACAAKANHTQREIESIKAPLLARPDLDTVGNVDAADDDLVCCAPRFI